jgi:hypothetical protein
MQKLQSPSTMKIKQGQFGAIFFAGSGYTDYRNDLPVVLW